MELTIRIASAVLGFLGAWVVAQDGVRHGLSVSGKGVRRAWRKVTGYGSTNARMSGATLTSPGALTIEQQIAMLNVDIETVQSDLANLRLTVASMDELQVRSDAWGFAPIALGIALGALPGEISRSLWAYVPVLAVAVTFAVISCLYLWRHRRSKL